jgi:hypothetical protein
MINEKPMSNQAIFPAGIPPAPGDAALAALVQNWSAWWFSTK